MSTDIRIERLLSATIERVYDAWSRPELLTQWDCPNPALDLKVDADVSVGGNYVVTMGPHVVRGNYVEVKPPHLLAFTWKWDSDDGEPSQVRVELSEVDGGTRMLLSHTGLSTAEDASGHLQGWEIELDRLVALLTVPQPDPAV
jgi:uncharacterized protein YndB with AHSA1/START domain